MWQQGAGRHIEGRRIPEDVLRFCPAAMGASAGRSSHLCTRVAPIKRADMTTEQQSESKCTYTKATFWKQATLASSSTDIASQDDAPTAWEA